MSPAIGVFDAMHNGRTAVRQHDGVSRVIAASLSGRRSG